MIKTERARRGLRRLAVVTLVSCTAVAGLGTTSATAATTPGKNLVGTFSITAGANAGPGVTGSYFRMIQPGGNTTSGPFLTNASSAAADQTYTYFTPGTDGGLKTGSYQASVQPAFDINGNALTNKIVQPTGFFGLNFSLSTESPDLQTATPVSTPSIVAVGGNLQGDLRAFGALWGGGTFNQGSPKPDGTTPGLTTAVTGTFNSTTNAYTLNWASAIVGGPFNGFTGLWHFEGTFTGTSVTPSITTTVLPSATRGVAYSAEINTVTPGTATKLKVSSGKLPKGLKLNKATGVISGTPKLKNVNPGVISFSITATSKKSKSPSIPKGTATQAFTLNLL
jgi:hypothetical protein